jgi:cytoskeleton protein RodZ
MSDDSTTRVISDSGNDVGPGQRLREAREAAKLTSAEVASRMRLEPYILEMLENDDYEQLHGPTFVRGYLSGYARLLNLPERPILEAYERHGFGPPALVSELGGKTEVHVSDFPVRMTTYVIAGLLVVLVVMWWQSRQAPTDSPEIARGLGDDTATVSPQPATSPATGPASDSAGVGDASSVSAVTSVSPSPDARRQPDSAAGGSESTDLPAPGSEPMTEGEAASKPPPIATVDEPTGPAAGGGTAPAESIPESVTVEEPRTQPEAPTNSDDIAVAAADSPAETAATTDRADSGADQVAAVIEGADTDAETAVEEEAPPPRPQPLPGSDVLAIQLQRESWIEIYDRGGGRLYYSLAREGSEIVVRGAGPMQVLLGDVEGAAVAYNGEPFDLSRYRGRSVVRFTIGELSTTAPETPPPATEEPSAPSAPNALEPTARERQRERERTAAVVPETLAAPSPTVGSPEETAAPPANDPTPPVVRPDS